jgi:hypothetical protein
MEHSRQEKSFGVSGLFDSEKVNCMTQVPTLVKLPTYSNVREFLFRMTYCHPSGGLQGTLAPLLLDL